jgi:hypothetical protein
MTSTRIRIVGIFALGVAVLCSGIARAGGPQSSDAPATATPTPEPTNPPKNGTDTPTLSPTPTLAGAPVPGTAAGARILGNVFHPLRGERMTLEWTLPEAATVDVDIYDRNGREVAHFSVQSGAGLTDTAWDGQDGKGDTLATGIYIALVHGGGLQRTLKFAVLK